MRRIITTLVLIISILITVLLLVGCDDAGSLGLNLGLFGGDDKGQPVTVTCYLNGTTEAPTAYTVSDGILVLPEIPKRDGYTFCGLFDSPQGGGMVMDATGNCLVVFNSSMTVYAQWTPQTFYFVFDGQGGEMPEGEGEMTVTYGSTISRFPAPTKEGYTFTGWVDSEGNSYSAGASVLRDKQTFNSDNYPIELDTVRLFATFEIAEYSVIFDFNDGTYRTEEIKVTYGSQITEDMYPTEGIETANKRVSGWALSPDGTQPFGGVVKSNITLYAMWRDFKTFILSDTLGNETEIVVYRDEPFDLVGYDGVTRPGYELDGWFNTVTYSGSPITEIKYTSPDKTYYAKWKVATYSLVFDSASAGREIAPLTYCMGDDLTLETISRDGLTFRGWSDTVDGSGAVFTKLPDDFWGDHTLYAIYEPAFFDMTLWSDGGTLPAGQGIISIEYTKTYTLPIPEKTGFIFEGWFDGTGKKAKPLTDLQGASLAPYLIIGESTAYARWTPVTYTVSFDTVGGSTIDPLTVNHGDKVALPDAPTLKDRIFTGWYTDAELTTRFDGNLRVNADMTLYAGWIISTPISTADELLLIATNPDANYHLTKDINLGGKEWTPIPEYRGILDGKGYKIHNFSITVVSSAGFFAVNSGTVQNITFADFSYTSSGALNTGVIAGANQGAICNCSVIDGVMTNNASAANYGGGYSANSSGAICGTNAGTVDGCFASITIAANASAHNSRDSWSSETFTFNYFVGGLVGTSSGTLKNSTAESTITLTTAATSSGVLAYANASVYLGGAVGVNDPTGTVQNCSSVASVSIGQSSRNANGGTFVCAGGFIGNNQGTVDSCISYGKVEENALGSPQNYNECGVGGFVGANATGSTIINCYSSADTLINSSTSAAGGFAYKNFSNITNCYACGKVRSNIEGPARAGFVTWNVSGGSISKCFAAGNMFGGTTANTASFVVTAENGSSCFKHYYCSEMVVSINDIPASPAIINGEMASSDMLKTESFIFETLSWDPTAWRVPADGYPVLIWQD